MTTEIQRECRNCLWGDQCPEAQACDYYTPLDDGQDSEINEWIEERRYEYREAWFDYIQDRGGDAYF